MGKIKEIYEMVQDGTADLFIDAYKNARIHNELGFTYDYRYYDVAKARAIVSLIQKATIEYDRHIDIQADAEYDSQWLEQ
jgi:hypothetical protein